MDSCVRLQIAKRIILAGGYCAGVWISCTYLLIDKQKGWSVFTWSPSMVQIIYCFDREIYVSTVWIWMCLCEPGDGASRPIVQNSWESSGGLLLGPVGWTHTKTLLSHSQCDTHTGRYNYTWEVCTLLYIHKKMIYMPYPLQTAGMLSLENFGLKKSVNSIMTL